MKRGTKILLWSLAFFGPIWWIYPIGLLGGAKATLSPETTRITSPLKADGTPDYAAWHNARDGAGVTADNNAAVVLAPGWMDGGKTLRRLKVAPSARTVAPQWFNEWAKASRGSLSGPSLREAEDFDKAVMAEESESYVPWTSQAHPDLAAWLRDHQPFVERILAASRRERFFVPIEEGEGLPWRDEIRRDANFLRAHTMQCAGEGRVAEALEDVRAMRRLAKLVAGSRSSLMAGLIGAHLERTADEALAQLALVFPKEHPLRPELAKLTGEPALDFEALVVRALREGERDDALGLAQTFFQQQIFEQETFSGRLMLRVLQDQMDTDRTLRRIHAMFDGAITRQPLPKTRRMSDKDAMGLLVLSPPGLRSRMLTAPIASAMEEWLPSRSMLDASANSRKMLRAFLPATAALGAWRADHGGTYPTTLSALVPGYLPQLPKLETNQETWIYETADAGKAFGLIRVKESEKELYTKRPLGCSVAFSSPSFEKAREREHATE